MPGLNLPFNLTFDLIAIGDVIAATIVTAHILLNKRNVRAAVGWIGLAWFSPILGSAIYFIFGINRVERRATRLRHRTELSAASESAAPTLDLASVIPESILSLAKVGGRLTNDPIVAGNSITFFQSGDEAYPVMLEAIHSARKSIALASYIFRADHVGNVFIEALCAAHRKGVEIRVLVDGIGSGYFFSSAARALLRAGIPVERFLHDWLPWRMPFLNMRNHKKLLIIDGAIGFTGGLNLGGENIQKPRIARAVEDIHFKVQGPAVSMLMRSFMDDWTFTCDEILDGPVW